MTAPIEHDTKTGEMVGIPAQQRPPQPSTPHAPGGAPSWRRPAVAIAAAAALGLFVGAGAGFAAGSSDASDARAETAAAVRAQHTAENRAASAQQVAHDDAQEVIDSERNRLAAEVDVRQSELDARESDLDRRTDAIAENADKLDAREAKLDKREREITSLERQAERNTIPGDGIFAVGSDIRPGLYKSTDNFGCYWARLSSFDTFDIIDNGNTDGPLVLQVRSTDVAIELSGCSDLRKVA